MKLSRMLLFSSSTTSSWVRSLSFFGWTLLDLFLWWMLSQSTLDQALEGKSGANNFVGRMLIVTVSCLVLAALNNVVKPFDMLVAEWRRISTRKKRIELEVVFALMFSGKAFVGCLCLYGILANVVVKTTG